MTDVKTRACARRVPLTVAAEVLVGDDTFR